MNDYLIATQFAAEKIIETYARDFKELNDQIARYNAAAKQLRDSSTTTSTHQDEVRAFTAARESSLTVRRLSTEMKAREFATKVLCASLLQIAKQGLSIVHGAQSNWPTGRQIGSQPITTIILQARNQAMHYEEGNLRNRVRLCFQLLDADFNKGLSPRIYRQNLATEVIDILGWHTFDAYMSDMGAVMP